MQGLGLRGGAARELARAEASPSIAFTYSQTQGRLLGIGF